MVRLALYQPDIPQNTGTILRLSACLDIKVDIIGPTGFDMTDRALRRAGLDYLSSVDIKRHQSFQVFYKTYFTCSNENHENTKHGENNRTDNKLVLLTTHADQSYIDFNFQANDILLLGRESAGVPEDIHKIAENRIKIPIRKDLRSLNIAIAAAMVLGEALRQTDGF